ncbi:hypothetical protein [Arachidicoccus ginsenosidimutans]|uniref:hypothetical protein n=1 Tax=Arachidicoccus sp. BS20 TaxID=1850526 RepID=UPI0012E88F9C|nr:hypothetical protein [Arachidicoccus sp. BS20]
MEHKYLSKDVRYTISTHHSTSHTTRGPYYNYRFEYKGRIYYGSTSITLDTIFIKFSTIDPNYNEATYIKATEEDIKNMPKDGYIKLPHD